MKQYIVFYIFIGLVSMQSLSLLGETIENSSLMCDGIYQTKRYRVEEELQDRMKSDGWSEIDGAEVRGCY